MKIPASAYPPGQRTRESSIDIRPLREPVSPFLFFAQNLENGLSGVPEDKRPAVREVIAFLHFMASELPDVKHTEPIILFSLGRCATHHEIASLFRVVTDKMNAIIAQQFETGG